MAVTLRSDLPTLRIPEIKVGPNQTIIARDLVRGLKTTAPRNPVMATSCETVSSVNCHGDYSTRNTLRKPHIDQISPTRHHLNDGRSEPMEMLPVKRTYTKKTKLPTSWSDILRTNPPTSVPYQSDENHQTSDQHRKVESPAQPVTAATSDVQSVHSSQSNIQPLLVGDEIKSGQKHRQQPLEAASTPEAESRSKSRRRKAIAKKRKKRILPTDGLALVPKLPSEPATPDGDHVSPSPSHANPPCVVRLLLK